LVARYNQLEHIGSFEGIDATLSQQPNRVEVRCRGEPVLLGHAPCHAQLTASQAFAAYGVDFQRGVTRHLRLLWCRIPRFRPYCVVVDGSLPGFRRAVSRC
jgi:hypothetical protein